MRNKNLKNLLKNRSKTIKDLNNLLGNRLKMIKNKDNLIQICFNKNLGFAEQSKLIQSKQLGELKKYDVNLKIKKGDELILKRTIGNTMHVGSDLNLFEIRYLLNDIQVFNFNLLFTYESNLKFLNEKLIINISDLKNEQNEKIIEELYERSYNLIFEDLIFLHDEKQKFKNEGDFFNIEEIVLNLSM